MYDQSALPSNVHILLHIAQSVVDWESIHNHSRYVFEAGNGKILKHVHAAKGVINQICRNIKMNRSITIMENNLKTNEEESLVLQFVKGDLLTL